jgi:hypothetical protein
MDSATPKESMSDNDSLEPPSATDNNDDGTDDGHQHPTSVRTPSASTWKSPARSTRSAVKTPQRQEVVQLLPHMMSPPVATDASLSNRQFVEAIFRGNGTCETPYVFIVDFMDPFNNGGFEIFYVHNKRINDHLHDVVHIRKPADKEPERFKCSIPSVEDTDPRLLKRVVLCQVPKVPYDHREHHSLWCGEFGCDKTTEVITAQRLRFKGHQTHYKFIFPENIKLDNHVISNNPHTVARKALLTGEDYDDNGDDIPVGMSLSVSFEIATESSIRMEDSNEDGRDGLKDQWKKRKARNKKNKP